MASWLNNPNKAIVPFERVKKYITASSALVTMVHKYGYVILRLTYYNLPTSINNQILVNSKVIADDSIIFPWS